MFVFIFFFQAEDGIRDKLVTGVQTCALPISLLVRFLSGVDHTTRPVKISDSGRIRNELQTMIPQALEHDGDHIRVRFERINEMVLSRQKQATIQRVLAWYKANHPVWFAWLDLT